MFSWTPDIDDGFENDSPTFLGTAKRQEDILSVSTEFILRGNHEVSVAVAFHFEENRFSDWPSDFYAAIPAFYWFRCNYNEENFRRKLDARLLEVSVLYTHLKEFFESPNDPAFEQTKQKLQTEYSFESLFDRYK
jgi:hypothetical protein